MHRQTPTNAAACDLADRMRDAHSLLIRLAEDLSELRNSAGASGAPEAAALNAAEEVLEQLTSAMGQTAYEFRSQVSREARAEVRS